MLDCQWIRRLHSYGLLTASFRPADEIVRWRGFVRQRDLLIRYAAQHVQHLQKTLEEMNVKLTEVVSRHRRPNGDEDHPGHRAWRTRPAEVGQASSRELQSTEAEMARRCTGTWRAEHLFALKQALKLYEFYQKQLRDCEVQIE